MAPDHVRRAAGTKTFTDLALHLGQGMRMIRGLPATDPALDLEYLANGIPLAVAAHCRTDERVRAGRLILHSEAASPILWIPGRLPRRTSSGMPVRAPIEVDHVSGISGTDAWRTPAWQFRSIDIHADGDAWKMFVPAIDLNLVLAAVAMANRR